MASTSPVSPLTHTTGNTVYVTVAGIESLGQEIQVVYRSTDGRASWNAITSNNLPATPANSLAVDPQNANTVYLATDDGVYYTTEVADCAQPLSNCWSVFGSGLPDAPVVALSAAPVTGSAPVLVAATYGRGLWQTALSSAGTSRTTASVSPSDVAFTQTPGLGVPSNPIPVTLTNTGIAGDPPLTVTSILIGGADPGDFSETDTCGFNPAATAPVALGSNCTINLIFTPQVANQKRAAVMSIYANVPGGELTVDMSGTGVAPGSFSVNPQQLTFPVISAGQSSAAQSVTVTNSSSYAIGSVSLAATAPFRITQNTCTGSLAAGANCTVAVVFQPSTGGAASGTLTVSSTDFATPTTVALSGTGFDFSVTFHGPYSQTVTSGEQANYTLVITPVGSSGTFSFACGTPPPNAICLFSPSSETLGAGVVATSW